MSGFEEMAACYPADRGQRGWWKKALLDFYTDCLKIAVVQKNLEMVRHYIALGADVNAVIDKESDLAACLWRPRSTYDFCGGKISLLSLALSEKNDELLQMLLRAGAVSDPHEDDGDREAQAEVLGPDLKCSRSRYHSTCKQDIKGKSPQRTMPVQHGHNSTEIQTHGAGCDPQSSQRVHPADDHTVRVHGVDHGNQAHSIDVDEDRTFISLQGEIRYLGSKEHFKERFSQILQQYSANGKNGINLAILSGSCDLQGRNLLHWAAMLGNNGALEALAEVLERRSLVNLLNAQDRMGKTPLILAVQAGHSSTVALLCRTGPSQFAEKIEPNIEDCTGKTALDHAKSEKKDDIVTEMQKRADVQYDEAQCDNEIKWIATRLAVVGTAAFGLLALMSNQFSGPSNGQGVVGNLTVSVACVLSSCVAALMFVWVPSHKKAARLYLSHVFAIAFPMCLLSFFSFLFGLLISPINISLPTTSAPQLVLPCLAAVVTLCICVCSRAYAIDKYGAQRFFPRKDL